MHPWVQTRQGSLRQMIQLKLFGESQSNQETHLLFKTQPRHTASRDPTATFFATSRRRNRPEIRQSRSLDGTERLWIFCSLHSPGQPRAIYQAVQSDQRYPRNFESVQQVYASTRPKPSPQSRNHAEKLEP